MKYKVVVAMLTVIGSLALSATAVQAGAGGQPSLLTSFFICNQINGDDAAANVDVRDSNLLNNPVSLRLGNASLACAFAKLFQGGTALEPNINKDPNLSSLKCYSVSVAKKPGPVNRITVDDTLTGDPEVVQMTGVQFICAPASYTFPQ